MSFAEYEEALEKFYNAVNWNSHAESAVQKLINQSSKPNASYESSDEENPYSEEEMFPPSIANKPVVAPRCDTILTLDAEKCKEALKLNGVKTRPAPRCLAEEWLHFALEERRALYHYTLKNTSSPITPPELVFQENEVRRACANEDEVQKLQRERDLKRRRQAYRTASTGAKTLNEVTREMIDNLMVLIGASQITQECKNEENTEVRTRQENTIRINKFRDADGTIRSHSRKKNESPRQWQRLGHNAEHTQHARSHKKKLPRTSKARPDHHTCYKPNYSYDKDSGSESALNLCERMHNSRTKELAKSDSYKNRKLCRYTHEKHKKHHGSGR